MTKEDVKPVEMEVVEVESDEVKLLVSVAPEDYSAIYELTLYKQTYDNKTEEWSEDAEVTKRYNESIEQLGGEPYAGQKLELYLDEEKGKAYLNPPKEFLQAEKPKAKDDGKFWLGATIIEVRDNDKGRECLVDYKGTVYSFTFTTGQWIKSKEKFILNPAKRAKQIEKFAKVFEKVGATWEDYKAILGLKVNLQVKKNGLDPKSPDGWLSVAVVEDVEYNQQFIQEMNAKENAELEDADVPF